MSKRPAAAAITLQRPPEPITTSSMAAAVQPLLDLLGISSLDDVRSIHVYDSRIRVAVVPRHRGRRQHDSVVSVTYPVAFDPDQEDE
jgi:hypothetical protein